MKSYMTYEMKLQEMFDDGMEKGLEKGMEKGMEKGAALEKQATVLEMLRDGADRRMIARYTRLSLPEIETIARENRI